MKHCDPYAKTSEGVGYLGVGEYSRLFSLREYNLWAHMLTRCYSASKLKQTSAYEDSTVVKRWHNFQNFCEDIHKLPNWNKAGFELDKDLRIYGNKKYGPKYCSFVPAKINKLANSLDKIDVQKVKNRWRSRITIEGKRIFLGSFLRKRDAVLSYMESKKAYLQELAKKYKKLLHREVYETFMTFEFG